MPPSAATVTAVLTFNDGDSPTTTWSLVPSKLTPVPTLPGTHAAPFCSVPSFPCPELSAALVPVPSFSARYSTSPLSIDPGALVVAVAVFDTADSLPAASTAVTR